jgi:hypothetical protein
MRQFYGTQFFSRRRKMVLTVLMAFTLGFVTLGATFIIRSVRAQSSPHLQSPKSITPAQAKACQKCSEPGQQVIYAPIFSLPEAASGEIVLNCRSPHEMEVTPTFYTLDGTAIVGEKFLLSPTTVKPVSVASLIPESYRGTQLWGGMSLVYFGQPLEVWAQLTLHQSSANGSVDVLFAMERDRRSGDREAVWRMPKDATATLTLGNLSNTPVKGTVTFSDGASQELFVAPFATEIMRRQSEVKPSPSGEALSAVVHATENGASLVATGFVTTPNSGFIGNIRFYDPPNTVQSDLFATGFRVADTDAHMLLKNTTDLPITARPRFRAAGGDAANPIELPPIMLAPQQIVEADIQPLKTAARSRNDLASVSVEVVNSGPAGSLIGALSAVNNATGVAYDIPLRDSGVLRNHRTGAYPWRVDDDYSTVVSITNVGKASAQFLAEAIYPGGRYTIEPTKLDIGETATFDLRKLRDDRIAVRNGATLPMEAEIGQFRWTAYQPNMETKLIGRSEVTSVSKHVSASFSCPVYCPPAGPFINGSDPLGPIFTIDSFQAVNVFGVMQDSYGYTSGPFVMTMDNPWFNPRVMTLRNDLNPNVTFFFHGLSPGFSGFGGSSPFVYYDNDGMDCYQRNDIIEFSDLGAVRPMIQGIFPSTGAESIVGANNPNYPRGLVGSMFEATIRGRFGDVDTASVVIERGGQETDKITKMVKSQGPANIFADLAIQSDAPVGDGYQISVVINGVQSNKVNFFVQEPKSLRRDRLDPVVIIDPNRGNITNAFGTVILSNVCGAYRNLIYTLVDQQSMPILQPEALVQETFANQNELPGLSIITAEVPVGGDGRIGDVVAITSKEPGGPCPPPTFVSTSTQTFQVKVGQRMIPLTTRNNIRIEKQASGTYVIEINNVTP